MEANVKPGTRCECQRWHEVANAHDGHRLCPREAVRMVTVRDKDGLRYKTYKFGNPIHCANCDNEIIGNGWLRQCDDRPLCDDCRLGKLVPMCAACADWHESKGVAK